MTIQYKGYIAKAEIDEDEKRIVGRVINMGKDGITFSGSTVEEAEKDFQEAAEDYLSWAQEEGFEPEKPFRGEILVRTTPELHRDIATASAVFDTSINQFVVDALKDKLKKAKKNRDRWPHDMTHLKYTPA